MYSPDLQKLFICENLGYYSMPIYAVDNNSICYTVEDNGDICKINCSDRIKLKLLDPVKFNITETINKLLKFIINDYLMESNFKIIKRSYLHLLPATNIVCNNSLSTFGLKNAYYIEDLDDNILMTLPEPEYFGYLCYKGNVDITEYSLFGTRGSGDPVEIFIIE